jgi:hypothetical protein
MKGAEFALRDKVLDDCALNRDVGTMSLTKLLFEPTLLRSPLRVIQWWESRRPAYNLIVGAAGVGTLIYANALSLLARGQWFPVPWQAIVAYGVAANVCYTFGWVIENLVERWLDRPVYGLGPALFRHGLAFSVGLTLFPAAIVTFMAIVGFIFR